MVVVWLILSAVAGGALNSIAGGGTLLTFPALLLVASVRPANMTSTIALLPGTAAGVWGYRKELADLPRWAWLLTIPSFLGGTVGAILLTVLDEVIFRALVPWLVLLAAILILLQPYVSASLRKRHGDGPPGKRTLALILVAQFCIGVYGGYFGAGIGILMLSALGFLHLRDIHQMNALKSCLGFIMNGVSGIFFACSGEVQWTYALIMALASMVGGYAGARLSLRCRPIYVRWFVIAVGFLLAGYFFWAA